MPNDPDILDTLKQLPLKQQDGTVPASFRGDAYHDWWAGWEDALESVNVPALIARIEADGAELTRLRKVEAAAKAYYMEADKQHWMPDDLEQAHDALAAALEEKP